MSTISDIVKTMTPEEREKHKALIEECRRRELNIQLDLERAKHMLPESRAAQNKFYKGLQGLTIQAHKTLAAVSDASLALSNYSFNQYCKRKEKD